MLEDPRHQRDVRSEEPLGPAANRFEKVFQRAGAGQVTGDQLARSANRNVNVCCFSAEVPDTLVGDREQREGQGRFPHGLHNNPLRGGPGRSPEGR